MRNSHVKIRFIIIPLTSEELTRGTILIYVRHSSFSIAENLWESIDLVTEATLSSTGFFHTGKKLYCNTLRESRKYFLSFNLIYLQRGKIKIPWEQRGILRT